MRSARGPLRLDSSPIGTVHNDWSLASSFTRLSQCMDMSHIDRKLNLDAEPRSLSEVMVRGELNWVAMLGFARARSRGLNMAGLL